MRIGSATSASFMRIDKHTDGAIFLGGPQDFECILKTRIAPKTLPLCLFIALMRVITKTNFHRYLLWEEGTGMKITLLHG